jgi:hypothetical protein
MFQQKQSVADKVLLSRANDLLLNGHSLRVGDSTEMEKVDMHRKLRSLSFRVKRKQASLAPGCPLYFSSI